MHPVFVSRRAVSSTSARSASSLLSLKALPVGGTRRCLSSGTTPTKDQHHHHQDENSQSRHHRDRSRKARMDMRAPLVVGGSLCAASTIQYYHMNKRGFATPGSIIKAPAGPMGSSPAACAPQASSPAAATSKLAGLDVTIYQYKICPFCCKVKAVLDFYKIPYQTLDVNPLTKAEIKFLPHYRKVPIAKIGEEVVLDSSVIVKHISGILREANMAPKADLDRFFSTEANQWAEWADGKLAVLLFPNITRTFDESYQAFSYVKEVPHFSLTDKWSNLWIGSTAMWAAQGKIKKKYNITDERAALFTALQDWMDEVGSKPFVGGEKPNLGDLCVYACIRAIEGLDAHKDILANTKVEPWYRRVEQAIGESTCLKAE